jgi:hypothetical protein
MATQQVYNPPTEILPTFNSSVFSDNNTAGLTIAQGDARYLKFPFGQGDETLPSTLTVTGLTTLNGGLTASGTSTLATLTASADATISGMTVGKGTGSNNSSNTSLGYRCLANNTSGGNNTGGGNSALVANTAGLNCTAFGFNALATNTVGNHNTAFGMQALYNNLAGNFNTSVGTNALLASTSNNNTAVGYQALTTTTGFDNTAIGYLASTASNLNSTTALGSGTVITGTLGTAIGKGASAAANATAIGYNANAAANTVTLGTATETVTIPGPTTATGLVTTNGGVNTTTVGFSYSTLPTFTSSQIGYTTPEFSWPATSLIVGQNSFTFNLGVGVWQVFAYVVLFGSQTIASSTNSILRVSGGARQAYSVISADGLSFPTISAIFPLTASSTTIQYTIGCSQVTTINTTAGVSRFYAVRIA